MPTRLLSSCASNFELDGRVSVLDPCAGDGEALERLCEALGDRAIPLACELEAERAEALRGRGRSWEVRPLEGDAMLLRTQAQILFLNPPYDSDPNYGRLEHRFLSRLTRECLEVGGGLIFVIPTSAIRACARFLAEHFDELCCRRFPDPEFADFRQVVIFGRRREPVPGADTARIRSWTETDRLPILGPAETPLRISGSPWRLVPRFELDVFDLELLCEQASGSMTHADEPLPDLDELIGGTFGTAVPPKPAHIALAISSGMLNGHEIEPDDPRRHPPILAKGTLSRRFVEIDRRTNSDGEVTGVVEVQRPNLSVQCLDLRRYRYFQLLEGVEPNGGDDPERWTLADLMVQYGRGLTRLLARQFPALHDPSRDDHRLPLPALARTPYRAQRTAVEACLKLIARGENPFVVAEVGTGKSTIALYLTAALRPEFRSTLGPALERQGLPGRLPSVRRTLILCPPHLLDGWKEQIEAVRPGARVVVLGRPGDLHDEADLYLLSRETAKLGHARRGIEGRCPRCGAPIEEKAADLASKRRRCGRIRRRPDGASARFLVELLPIVAPFVPDHELVDLLLPHHPALRRSGRMDGGPSAEASGSEAPASEAPASQALRALLRSELCRDDAVGRWEPLRRLLAWVEPDEILERIIHQSTSGGTWARQGWLEALRSPRPGSGFRETIRSVLSTLWNESTWIEEPPCGEPLFQAVPEPRRVPLATYIARRAVDRFDLLIVDEAHEFGRSRTAQTLAFQRLAQMRRIPTVVLTGSLMNGYASSLFPLFHTLSAELRREFDREQLRDFVDRYGFIKQLVPVDERAERFEERGVVTDRRVRGRRLGEAPGILATFIVRHLLRTAVVLHKDDLDVDIPPITERVEAVEPDPSEPLDRELLAEYARLQTLLLERIREDRWNPDRAGRLIGQLVELPSYLDRASRELGPFELRYPESLGGETLGRGEDFPDDYLSPKERRLLELLRERRAAGERILIFLRHTRGALPRRLRRLIDEHLGDRSVFLDASKVSTRKRQEWIERKVVRPDVPILLVNPNAVRTGLNNLVGFSTAVWFEVDPSASTYRQANGRLHRIGQIRPVTVVSLVYRGTAQEVLLDLVAKKVSTSLQVDGLDVQAALEAAGVGSDDAMELALSIGQAVYRRLVA